MFSYDYQKMYQYSWINWKLVPCFFCIGGSNLFLHIVYISLYLLIYYCIVLYDLHIYADPRDNKELKLKECLYYFSQQPKTLVVSVVRPKTTINTRSTCSPMLRFQNNTRSQYEKIIKIIFISLKKVTSGFCIIINNNSLTVWYDIDN